ncbi:MAG: Hsp70 family protein [Chloroflexota bacterium]
MVTKLFISYRSLDSAKVDKIVNYLEKIEDNNNQRLYEVWQDKHSIPVGQDWWKAIVQGIIDCDIFIFMISRDSVKNINCRAELSYAYKRNRPIIPIVLEDEYIYNSNTAKNDITYWKDVPHELRDSRLQFLFYEGLKFHDELYRAYQHIQIMNFPDYYAPEPPDPRHVDDQMNDTTLIYDKAVDYAHRMEFDMAEKLFRRLVNWSDPLFGEDAHQWIILIREYEQIMLLEQRESVRYKVRGLWAVYSEKFPKPFTQFFDPKNLSSQIRVEQNTLKEKPESVSSTSTNKPEPEQQRHTSCNTTEQGKNIEDAEWEDQKTPQTKGKGNFEDIFEDIFKSFIGGKQQHRKSGLSPITVPVVLSMQEAYAGKEVEIKFNRYEQCEQCKGTGNKHKKTLNKCSNCKGSGEVRRVRQTFVGNIVRAESCDTCEGTGSIPTEPYCKTCEGKGKTIESTFTSVKIPAGVLHETKVRLQGLGHQDRDGNKGDVMVTPRIQSHPTLSLDKDGHIRSVVVINDTLAKNGGKVNVETIDNIITLKIPKNTPSGRIFRLGGKGFPKVRQDGTNNGRHDHYVTVRLTSQFSDYVKNAISIETLGGVATQMFPPMTALPTSVTQIYSTASDNQKSVEIKLCYGNSAMASDNMLLGTFTLDNIPPAPRGIPQIEVTIEIDELKNLTVSARDQATNYQQTLDTISLANLD